MSQGQQFVNNSHRESFWPVQELAVVDSQKSPGCGEFDGDSPVFASSVWGGLNRGTEWLRELLLQPLP